MKQETRYSGTWICGAQGSGKSTLMLTMLASDLQKDAAIIVCDPKGDLSGPIRELDLGHRLVVLSPSVPFAINPLSVPKTDVKRAVNQLEYVFGALLDATTTPKQKALLRTILRAVVTGFPDPTLHTVQNIINKGPAPYTTYIQQLPPDLQDFFNNEWKSYESTCTELKWRIRLVMENDLVRKMFSAPRTRFDIGKSMDRGDVVIIDNSIEELHEDGSAFLGRFFLAQIWGAAMARQSRPRHKRKPVFVYLDEGHRILDTTAAHIIDMCRSANIALIIAHQRTKQIQDPNVLSALENCAIKMANVDAEAHYFSKLLHIPEERINTLPVGQFAMHVRGEGSSITKVRMAKLPFPIMTDKQKWAHSMNMQGYYGIETHKGPTEAEPLHTLPARHQPGADKPIVPNSKHDPSAPTFWKPPK